MSKVAQWCLFLRKDRPRTCLKSELASDLYQLYKQKKTYTSSICCLALRYDLHLLDKMCAYS